MSQKVPFPLGSPRTSQGGRLLEGFIWYLYNLWVCNRFVYFGSTIYGQDREPVVIGQWGCTVHSLSGWKSLQTSGSASEVGSWAGWGASKRISHCCITSSNSSVVIIRTLWQLRQLLPKWPGSLHRKHLGATRVFLAISKSMGMGLLGDRWKWAWSGLVVDTTGRDNGAGLGRV